MRRTVETQAGFSLVEVMVSMLVTTVSLLGMAELQITSKQVGYEAIQRTEATATAMDILERMRSNPQALNLYVTTGVGGGSITAQPTPQCSNESTDACDATELAAHDLWAWEQAMDGIAETRTVDDITVATGGLVKPTGCIEVAGGVVTVTVAWQGRVALTSPGTNTCGLALGKYGTGDEKRQLVSVSTFITDE